MPWEKGILDGLSHVLDILPPDNLEHVMKIEDILLGLPVRHWLYRNDQSFTYGLLLFVKKLKVQSKLYIPTHPWMPQDRFPGYTSILDFYDTRKLEAKLNEIGVSLPPEYNDEFREMQDCLDTSDFRCFPQAKLDMKHGYRELVPVDEILNVLRARVEREY